MVVQNISGLAVVYSESLDSLHPVHASLATDTVQPISLFPYLAARVILN